VKAVEQLPSEERPDEAKIQYAPPIAAGFSFTYNPPKKKMSVCDTRHYAPVFLVARAWTLQLGSQIVISDLEIYSVAHLLIKRHGDEAPVEAAMHADELMEAGDMEGEAVWLRIIKAIEELLSEERPDDAEVH
jgi:hypothetical protein